MVKLSDTKGDDWAPMAKMYKQLTVGVSSRPISAMLEWANAYLPFSEATGIHDNGCGPGVIMERIIADYGTVIPSSAPLSASDFAQAMVSQVEVLKKAEMERNASSPWARVKLDVLNAMDLQGVADESLSHVTAGWVYFMTPDPMKCLSESKRVLKDGGVLACSSWQTNDWMEIMKVPGQVRPGLQQPTVPQEWASAPALKGELQKAGFQDVQSQEVKVTMSFDTHDALLEMLFKVMPHMVATMKLLTEAEQAEVLKLAREHIVARCPTEPGKLNGIALVAVGRKGKAGIDAATSSS